MKLLYLMHVNWYWIRQRPHVLAEELARHHELNLMHFAMYHSSHRAAESKPPFIEKVLWRLPERILRLGRTFERINAEILKQQLRSRLSLFKPDAVWVTHPVFEPVVRQFNEGAIIYDCMDDHLAFHANTSDQLAAAENRLLQKAKITIFSSQTLANRIKKRSTVRNSLIVNNGVADSLLRGNLLKIDSNKSIKSDLVFGYFGTISHWFDWPLVLRILENLPRARLRLAGPVETHIPQHPRIEYVGIFPHSALTEFVEDCNAFIMPFIVNPLIEAVDPVKLYEYIAYGLPTLAPRYPETERFLPWVNLYSNIDEAINISKSLLKTSTDKMTMEQRHEFLESNSWTMRCRKISEAMAKL